MYDQRLLDAARECIAQCNNWENPLPALASCVEQLIEKGWEPAAAHQVGIRALRTLAPDHPLLRDRNGKDTVSPATHS